VWAEIGRCSGKDESVPDVPEGRRPDVLCLDAHGRRGLDQLGHERALKDCPTKEGQLWSRTTHQTIRAHLAPGVGTHLAVRDAGYQALTMQTRLKLGHMVGHLN
jgi:hypothetical protein